MKHMYGEIHTHSLFLDDQIIRGEIHTTSF